MQETHASAGTPKRIPAYDALARDIKSRGISTVFGLMSDDTALFVTALDSMGVRFYGARHENTAVAMAEGYAAATGELGVAIIGNRQAPRARRTRPHVVGRSQCGPRRRQFAAGRELRQVAPLRRRPDGPILLDCKINASVAVGYHTETFVQERASH